MPRNTLLPSLAGICKRLPAFAQQPKKARRPFIKTGHENNMGA
jgi:hypothetical protein